MSKQNENRLGYKKTKIGWIPEEWNLYTLGKTCSVIMDGTHFSPKSKEGTFRYVTSKNIRAGFFNVNDCQYINKEEHKIIFSKCPVAKGQILLTKDGANTGNACINILDEPFSLLSSVAVLDGKKEQLNNWFLIQWLLSPRGQYIIQNEMSGLAITRLTLQTISTLPLPLPSLPEQKKIAEIISAWDRIIEQVSKLINAKTKLKKALMQQLLTGKWRFKEFVKTSKKQTTRYGLIPADWDYPKVGKVAEKVSTRNTNNSNITVLSCTKYDGLVESLKYFSRQVFSKDTSTYKVVKRGQFAYATNHIEEGSIGMLDILDEGLVSPMYTVFQTGDRVYTPFLYKVFKTELYRHIFEVNTNASVNRRGSLRWNGFALIHVPLPSFDEQRKVSDCIDAFDREISFLEREVAALKEQKKGLMQKLLTGNIRVKVLIKERTRHDSSEKR